MTHNTPNVADTVYAYFQGQHPELVAAIRDRIDAGLTPRQVREVLVEKYDLLNLAQMIEWIAEYITDHKDQ